MGFVLYQYKVKPDNERELYDRGQRVLNQLAENFVKKDKDIRTIFRDPSTSFVNLIAKDDNLGKLAKSVHYELDYLNLKQPESRTKVDSTPFLKQGPDGVWEMLYPTKFKHDSVAVAIKIDEFAKPLFGLRETNIFQSNSLK